MKKHLIAGAVVAAALALLAGCGSDDDSEADAGDATEDTTAAADGTGGAVSTADSAEGEILVDADGLSLYGFTADVDGVPTCDDACADAWPPVVVDDQELPEGLDAAVFSVAERSDGTFQLVAGDFPLYRFAGDSATGDVNGQGSGGTWFLAAPDGSLVDGATPAATEDESSSSGYDY